MIFSLSSLLIYQGSIDFKTVNINCTIEMFHGNRDDIVWSTEIINIRYTPCSPGSVLGNTALGTVYFLIHSLGQISGTHTWYLSFLLHKQHCQITNFTPKNWLKTPQNAKKCNWKVKYMQFLCSIWKTLTP